MKILIDHQLPGILAHGGLQIPLKQKEAGLEKVAFKLDHLRWRTVPQKDDGGRSFESTPFGVSTL